MKLPDNIDELSASFLRLAPKRKAQILEHLRATDGDRATATVGQIINNGGPEAEFMTHIFGKDAPARGESPDNKKINPPNVKATVPGPPPPPSASFHTDPPNLK